MRTHARLFRGPRRVRPVPWVLAVWVGLAGALTARADEAGERDALKKSSPKVLAAFRGVVAQPGRSTVRIQCDSTDVALGTITGPDGWVLTKASELKERPVCKLRDGRELDARVVGVYEPLDLAMLKIEAKHLTPVEWHQGQDVRVGHWVASPGTGADPAAVGVVSVAARNVPATVVPRPSAAYLGIAVGPAEGGVKITGVMPKSGADRAGLQVGDVLLSIAGRAVGDLKALGERLQGSKVGDILAITVKRGDKEVELKATMGKRPALPPLGQVIGLSSWRSGFAKVVEHDSLLRRHDCGGPLADLDGRVIGINIARASRVGSYAVPSEAVLPLLADLMSGKLAPKKRPPEEADKPHEKLGS